MLKILALMTKKCMSRYEEVTRLRRREGKGNVRIKGGGIKKRTYRLRET